jgi:hypothetical protein
MDDEKELWGFGGMPRVFVWGYVIVTKVRG